MENSPATSCRSSEIFMVLLLGKLTPSLSKAQRSSIYTLKPDNLLLFSQHHRGEHGYKLSCSGNSLQQGLETPLEDGMVQIPWEVYRTAWEGRQGNAATISPMSGGLLSPEKLRPFWVTPLHKAGFIPWLVTRPHQKEGTSQPTPSTG